MELFVVMADLDNDRREFHGVFSTQELAKIHVDKMNKSYGGNVCSWEATELDRP